MAEHEIVTLTVKGSQTMRRLNGKAAILLDTREQGPLAFEVDLHAIELLRHQLAKAEEHLRSKKRHTSFLGLNI